MAFTVSTESLAHRGGTKEYHLLMILDQVSGAGLIAMRWGKTGSFGQMKVEIGDEATIRRTYNSKKREKEHNGYSTTTDNNVRDLTAAHVKARVGPAMWAQLGVANIEHIMPGSDTKGVREPVVTEFAEDKNGKFRPVDKGPKFVIEEPKPIEESFEEKQAKDPLFGMF